MKIPEICDILRSELYNSGFSYGFILNGRKYVPDKSKGFDNDFYNLAKTISVLQAPSITLNEKTGTCIDIVVLMKSMLDRLNVPSKIWLTYNRAKNRVHTILTFCAENKTVYLELTPECSKPWYGKEIIYSDEEELLREYENNGYDISDVTESVIIGERPHFLLKKLI